MPIRVVALVLVGACLFVSGMLLDRRFIGCPTVCNELKGPPFCMDPVADWGCDSADMRLFMLAYTPHMCFRSSYERDVPNVYGDADGQTQMDDAFDAASAPYGASSRIGRAQPDDSSRRGPPLPGRVPASPRIPEAHR